MSAAPDHSGSEAGGRAHHRARTDGIEVHHAREGTGEVPAWLAPRELAKPSLVRVAALLASSLVLGTPWPAPAVNSDRAPDMEVRLPDGRTAVGTRQIAAAWLAAPTRIYRHGALGDDVEASAVVVRLASGGTVHLRLGDESVFEDLEPRLVDLDRDGLDEIVLIRAYLDEGASLAVLRADRSGVRPWVQSPPIGTPHRWLNPAGFGDFDGDGEIEIAHVQTPHIGGMLILSEIRDGRWVELARRAGVSNHAYGSRELSMSAVLDVDGNGRHALALPDQTRRNLVIARLEGGSLRLRRLALDRAVARLESPDGRSLVVTTAGGERVRLGIELLSP